MGREVGRDQHNCQYCRKSGEHSTSLLEYMGHIHGHWANQAMNDGSQRYSLVVLLVEDVVWFVERG